MGVGTNKEYTMDTMHLGGVQIVDEKTQTLYTLSQITADKGFYSFSPVFSVFSTIDLDSERLSTSINIGDFVDESGAFEPIKAPPVEAIKFYTGEEFVKGQIAYYPKKERFTISKAGRVGINSPNNLKQTLEVREGIPFDDFGNLAMPMTSSIAITQPFYVDRKGRTTPEFGNIFFRANISEDEDIPVTYSLIKSGNEGKVQNSYEDQRANLQFYTNTRVGVAVVEKKHLEINGFEDKTKIFTQLNLGNVPAFRDLKEAINGGLVTGDVWQDSEGTLKIMPDLSQGGERARIE
jgi:hypothetical protein